jgi:hypothetical protein
MFYITYYTKFTQSLRGVLGVLYYNIYLTIFISAPKQKPKKPASEKPQTAQHQINKKHPFLLSSSTRLRIQKPHRYFPSPLVIAIRQLANNKSLYTNEHQESITIPKNNCFSTYSVINNGKMGSSLVF